MNWVEEFNQTWQPGQLQQTARDHISSALSGKACIPETNYMTKLRILFTITCIWTNQMATKQNIWFKIKTLIRQTYDREFDKNSTVIVWYGV